MFQHAEKTVIAIKPEQCQVLQEMAQREGQAMDVFIEHILQDLIEKWQEEMQVDKNERINRNFESIRHHREAFLAKRHNKPLSIDTVALLNEIRDEHDEHALTFLKNYRD